MLNHPTIDQLKALKRDGMAEAFVELQGQENASDLGHAEWLALLLDREAANRTTKRVKARLRRPGCVTPKPPSRTSIIATRESSTKP